MDKQSNEGRLINRHNYYKIVTLLLRKGEIVKTPLYGRCMRPVINDGDIATIAPVELDKLICGDIVVYQHASRLKIHRLIGFQKISGKKYLITKGDKSIGADPPVSPSLFLGKVITVNKTDKVIHLESVKWRIINYITGKLSRPSLFIKLLKRIIKRKTKRTIKHFYRFP